MTNLAKPVIGMIIRGRRNGTMYRIAAVEQRQVYIEPYWTGQGSRSTWKTRNRLWVDYYRVDETAVTEAQP